MHTYQDSPSKKAGFEVRAMATVIFVDYSTIAQLFLLAPGKLLT